MEASAIRDAIKATPFRPFRLRLADGRELAVEHPDYLHVSPSGRQVVFYSKDERMSILEPLLIVSLERPAPDQTADLPSDDSNGKSSDAPT